MDNSNYMIYICAAYSLSKLSRNSIVFGKWQSTRIQNGLSQFRRKHKYAHTFIRIGYNTREICHHIEEAKSNQTTSIEKKTKTIGIKKNVRKKRKRKKVIACQGEINKRMSRQMNERQSPTNRSER